MPARRTRRQARPPRCDVLPLRSATPAGWTEQAIAELDATLIDHAHCERKAALAAMRLIASFCEYDALVHACVKLAHEELRHFRQVHELLLRRGLSLGRDAGDPYAHELQKLVRVGTHQRLTDQLLVNALIEARSCERLGLLAAALPEPTLVRFYQGLARAEAGHHRVLVRLAMTYDDAAAVRARLEELATAEAEIVSRLPLLPRIH